MVLLKPTNSYDRRKLLRKARRAAMRGRHKKAIALYERVRATEPEYSDVLRLLAAQRVRAGQNEEAWRDCQSAGSALIEKGFAEKACGVYRDFAFHAPKDVRVWHALADAQLIRERDPDAVAVLLEGRRSFRSRRQRQDAMTLLHRACKIDPDHFEASFDHADLLARSGREVQAQRMLLNLERKSSGRNLRRVRGRMFRLSPSPVLAWKWLVALTLGR